MIKDERQRRIWEILCLVLIGGGVALLYGHTLHVPFYLDDQWAIIDNYRLRDFAATARQLLSQRGLTNLTFAINLRMSGLSLPALHLTNIILHAGCGILVWLTLRRLCHDKVLPILGALLFVAHPLQTQAVTYLVQRATVLGAFFFLLAFYCYLRARAVLAAGCGRRSSSYLLPYVGAIAAGGCAMLAKENTATLPLVLMVYDWLFPLSVPRNRRQALLDYLPFSIAPLLIGLPMIYMLVTKVGTANLYVPLASQQHNSPLNYLFTEFSVIWVYLRLLLFPWGQALEHGYPVTARLLAAQNLVALAGLLAIALGAWKLRRRRPLLVLGVAWFFLALAVESSVIPLDPLFEHRLYLPMFGFVLVLLDGLMALFDEKRTAVILGLSVLICAPLSWQRNALWNDPVALYEDNLRHCPDSERASETLGALYGKVGRFEAERQQLEIALRRFPENPIVIDNLVKVYAEEKRWQEAYALLEEGFKRLPGNADFYETGAAMATLQGDRPRAVAYLQRGLTAPGADRGRLWNDLGVAYSEAGETVRAEEAFLKSLEVAPDVAGTYLNLGKEYFIQQRWAAAFVALERAQELMPGNPETLEGLGRSALLSGNLERARWAAEKLEFVDREAWKRLQLLIAGQGQGVK